MSQTAEGTKMSKEEFVLAAIHNLRTDKGKGIHVRFSGFNAAFEAEYGEASRATTDRMAEEGKITVRPAKGGAILYLPADVPIQLNVDSVLERIKNRV